jgi:tetrahydromethanopterin S-methyltransferase subunit G
LILGVDGMVRYHGESNDEAAFFHHELFHIIHQADLGPCAAVWCALWREGLAVHVSKALNPSANASEMLLDFPKGLLADVEKARQASLDDLSTRLDSEDAEVYQNLFQTRGRDQRLPVRRGYVLGWWIARHLGQTHSLQEMAEWDGPTVRRRVEAALTALRSEATR